MKTSRITRFIVYIILLLINASFCSYIIFIFDTYDPGWIAGWCFILIGLPFIFVGGIILSFIQMKKYKLIYEIITESLLLIIMTYLFFIFYLIQIS